MFIITLQNQPNVINNSNGKSMFLVSHQTLKNRKSLMCKNEFYTFIWALNTQIEDKFINIESALDLMIH